MVEKVFAVGGSVVKQNLSDLGSLADALDSGEQTVSVVGAGHLKENIEAVKDDVNNAEADLVGVAATRLNAMTLQKLLDNAHPAIPETLSEVEEAASSGQDIVMGGLNPGFSTDAVAALVAELFDTDLYIVTDVDGIYTGDPGEKEDAERLDEVSTGELLEMTSGENEPGVYSIVDETAVKIIDRSSIPAKVFRGAVGNIENPGNAEGTDIISQ